VGVAGLVLAVIGLAAPWFPIDLDQRDAYGFPTRCGNGFSSNLTVALGWLLVTVLLVGGGRTAPSRTDLLS